MSPSICAIQLPFSFREERFLVCVKEWVKYLLIPEVRGVEISQRQGERWSRFVQVFSIYAFLSVHLTRLSPSRLISPNKRWSLSMIFTGRSVATNPPLHLDAKSTTSELIASELWQSRQCNPMPLGEITTPILSARGCCWYPLNPLFLNFLASKTNGSSLVSAKQYCGGDFY